MENYLIVYGSTEGHTRNVAEHIGKMIRGHGFEAIVRDSLQADTIEATDEWAGFFIGASVHQGQHQPSVIRFVENNLQRLQGAPSVFFSVSLEAALPGDEHRATAMRYIEEFQQQTGWEPDRSWCVAGALRYTEYDFFKRFAMKLIARRKGQDTDTSKDHVYTDWYELDRKVEHFLKQTHGLHEETRVAKEQQS